MTIFKDDGRKKEIERLTACMVDGVKMSSGAAALIAARDRLSAQREWKDAEHLTEMMALVDNLERIIKAFTVPQQPAPPPTPKAPPATAPTTLWRNTEERVIELDQALHDLVAEFPDVEKPCNQSSAWEVFAKKVRQARAVLGE